MSYVRNPFFLLFRKREILDSPILKEFADDNFKFDENGRKFTQIPIEILLEKKKLLLTSNIFFPSVFKRLKLHTHKSRCLFGKGLTVLLKLVVQPYSSHAFIFFSSKKSLHSTVPVKLQNVEIVLKYEKAL